MEAQPANTSRWREKAKKWRSSWGGKGTKNSVVLKESDSTNRRDASPMKRSSSKKTAEARFAEAKALALKQAASENRAPEQAPQRTSPELPRTKVPVAPSPAQQSPQTFLDIMMKARGYSTTKYQALRTAFFNRPTPLQKASYHSKMVELVREKDLKTLRAIMCSGISPNPCNSHGESLVHIACRLAHHEALRVMIDCGTTLQVCDTMGRTPLHDACWRAQSCFDTVNLILKQDPALLLMADARGAVPLSYVRKDQWGAWLDFLYQKRDEFWPRRHIRFDGEQKPPALTQVKPNERPIEDPHNALTIELAELVVARRMSPREVRAVMNSEDTLATDSVTSFTAGSNSCAGSVESSSGYFSDSSDEDDESSVLSELECDLDLGASGLPQTKFPDLGPTKTIPETVEI